MLQTHHMTHQSNSSSSRIKVLATAWRITPTIKLTKHTTLYMWISLASAGSPSLISVTLKILEGLQFLFI